MQDSWQLIKEGRFEDVVLASKRPEQQTDPNLGLALLNLNRPKEALRVYQALIDNGSTNDMSFIMAGVCYWWSADREAAIVTWKKGLTTPYTDAAGGVVLPAILNYAGFMVSDGATERESASLLKKRWKTKTAQSWPGPVAGCLLGKLSEQELFSACSSTSPILEGRRVCQAHFWSGFMALRQSDIPRAVDNFRASAKADGAALLEAECYLARGELRTAR